MKNQLHSVSMVKKLISKAALARMANVSQAAVNKAVKSKLKPAIVGKKIDANHALINEYIASQVKEVELAVGVDSRYDDAVNLCRSKNRFTVSTITRGLKIGIGRAERIFRTMQATGADKPSIEKPVRALPEKIIKKQKSFEKVNRVDLSEPVNEVPEEMEKFADMTVREVFNRFGTETAFLDWLKATKAIEDVAEKRLKNAVTRGELVSRELMKVGVIEQFNAAHLKLLTDGAKTIARRVTAMNGAGRSVEDCEKFVAEQISSFIKPVKAKVARALKNA